MKTLVQTFFIAILTLGSLYAGEENHMFKHLAIENRLPGSNVYCVFQDSKGLIWFGIESVGLCKYNGINFIVYAHNDSNINSISNNFPLCIAEDTAGFLWIGTTNGLNRYDREKGAFTRFSQIDQANNSIPGNHINDVHIDKYNNVWVATRKGLGKFNQADQSFQNVLIGENTYTDGLPAIVSDIYEDNDGNIWVGSYSSGLFLIDSETNASNTLKQTPLTISKHWFPTLEAPDRKDNYAVLNICRFNDEHLMLGKVDGLCLFNMNTEKFKKYELTTEPDINYAPVSALCNDKQGRIWVGYALNGVVLIEGNNKQTYFSTDIYREGGIRSNSIRDIYCSRSGLIWIATKFKGIHTYDSRQEQLTKHFYNSIIQNKMGKKFILSIYEDPDENIWIGTKNNGLYYFNPSNNEISHYSPDILPGEIRFPYKRIECICGGANSAIWTGTENGLVKLIPNKKRHIKYNSYYIKSIVSDHSGNLWIGTNTSGIFHYSVKTDQIKRYLDTKKTDLFYDSTLQVHSISLFSDSVLWISTYNQGLYKYNVKTDSLFHFKYLINDSIYNGGNMVNKIFCDNSGQVWAGTISDGLFKYDNLMNKFTRINAESIYIPSSIHTIFQDKDDIFWMGTHEGLFRYNPNNGEASIYGELYGLRSLVIEQNAGCITSNNLVIAGGSEGLNVFNPEEINVNRYVAPLLITSVKVYDKNIAEDIDHKQVITINYDQDYVSVEFALADYTNPMQTQYAYMLEGFNKTWVNCENNNIATFTRLPIGKYVFRVKAINTDTPEISIHLVVKGPFWKEPYFIVLLFISLILLGIFFHFTRLKIVHKREIKLNALVEEKTMDLMELAQELEENQAQLEDALSKSEESDRLKTVFLANLSHEIRTPMNGIIGFTELLKGQNIEPDQQHKYVQIIQKSSERMLRIINDLIDISKIESNQLKLVVGEVNIIEIINEIYEFFGPFIESKGLEFKREIRIDRNSGILPGDKNRIGQVLTNLVNNSMKFTDSGSITLSCSMDEENIIVSVKDTGKGIPMDQRDIIFERFRQVEDTKSDYHEGSGLGLSISKAIVELHGGRMWVESALGRGSDFYFSLPAMHTNFRNTELLNNQMDMEINTLKGKKVLVAEDDEASFILVREILNRYDIEVYYARNGMEAIKMVKETPGLDLVLMDIKMPGLNGIEATREIKKINKILPVVIQSAFVFTYNYQNQISGIADDYISKPIQHISLKRMLQKFFT